MEEDVMESTEVDTPESSVEVSEEPSGDTYAVKVDGENQEVSLEELRDGYQRQSDYTRKTQELASERKRLQQAEAIVAALESDPAGTLTALGDAFGVENQPISDGSYDTDYEAEDPTSQRVAQLEARLEAQDRLQRRNEMEKQVDNLKERYGDFDESELYQHALSNRIGNLEAALTHMRYGDVADRAEKLEKEQERTEAKRDATVVEPKGSKQTGSSTDTVQKHVGSLREAYAEAKRELADN
jgi:anti-sigma-K factor RskA